MKSQITVRLQGNNNNNIKTKGNLYEAMIMAESLREFTLFTEQRQ